MSIFYNGPQAEGVAFFRPLLDQNVVSKTAEVVHFSESGYAVPPMLLKSQPVGGSLMSPLTKSSFGSCGMFLWTL